MSVFTGGPYGRLAVMLNTLSSLNIEIIILLLLNNLSLGNDHLILWGGQEEFP